MDFLSGVVVFLMIWWTALFVILPWGNRAPEEDEPVEGQVISAPVVPNLKKKFIATTLLTIVLWCVVAYLVHINFIDFLGMSEEMMKRD